MKYVDALADISVTDIKVGLMRTAYDNEGALSNSFDPCAVLVWIVLFIVTPWLFYDTLPLTILFVATFVLAMLSQINKYLLALLLSGQVASVDSLVVLVPLIGGAIRTVGRLGDNAGRVVEGVMMSDISVFAETGTIVAAAVGQGIHTATISQGVGIDIVGALVPFFLKLTVTPVTSLAVFSTMSPQKFSKGMLRLSAPHQLTLAIAYGYRMVSLPVEEYHAFIGSFRPRSKAPEKQGLFRWRYFSYLLMLLVKVFCPLILSVAKRSRVNIEVMETEGFSCSLGDEQSRTLRTEGMIMWTRDVTFVFGSLLFVIAVRVFIWIDSTRRHTSTREPFSTPYDYRARGMTTERKVRQTIHIATISSDTTVSESI